LQCLVFIKNQVCFFEDFYFELTAVPFICQYFTLFVSLPNSMGKIHETAETMAPFSSFDESSPFGESSPL